MWAQYMRRSARTFERSVPWSLYGHQGILSHCVSMSESGSSVPATSSALNAYRRSSLDTGVLRPPLSQRLTNGSSICAFARASYSCSGHWQIYSLKGVNVHLLPILLVRAAAKFWPSSVVARRRSREVLAAGQCCRRCGECSRTWTSKVGRGVEQALDRTDSDKCACRCPQASEEVWCSVTSLDSARPSPAWRSS
jgi:hypothetical protein